MREFMKIKCHPTTMTVEDAINKKRSLHDMICS